MTKNVNLRLDDEKDRDLLEAMEHSLISNPQLFKLLARVALSNKEELSLQGMFDNGYFDNNSIEKPIQNDTKVSKPMQVDTNQNKSNHEKMIQSNTNKNKPVQDDKKTSNVVQNNASEKDTSENQEEDFGATLFKGLGK